MRRNVCGHADGNPSRTVDQEVRDLRRQDRRFLQGAIVVGHEIDRFLVDIFQHFAGNLSHTDFGITHGSGRVAVNRTKVAVAIDQGIARREILSQADGRIIDGDVTMGVILT